MKNAQMRRLLNTMVTITSRDQMGGMNSMENMKSQLNYVAIGDSLTAGYGVPYGFGFAERYQALAEQALGVPLILYNAGVSGSTSVEMLKRLIADHSLRERIREADLITFTFGGNDLLNAAKQFYVDQNTTHLKQALKATRASIGGILREVKEIKKQAPSASFAIRVADLYNPIPFFPESVYWVQRFNKIYRKYEGNNLLVADIYHAFLGQEEQLLSDDLIHPNSLGYERMAMQTHALGYAPFL
jgi:lysophospholipase L1-like esterase